ncbi:MAG: hypothetical protein FJW20_13450 [Acidimicrobiia bacterium]|nr:hypothetical protein [Acidimicrobiia bacterium]
MLAFLLLATFTGSDACADCHRGIFDKQARSAHANALRPYAGSPLAARLKGSITTGPFRLTYSPDSVEAESASMQLEWSFGSGTQAYTGVGRNAANWIEHRISLYTASSRLSLTPGHFGRQIVNASDALGIIQDPPTIARCFNCHAARTRATAQGVDLSRIEPGVKCERCHGPGSDHIAAAKAGRTETLGRSLLNSGRFSARASVQVCGECHRTPPARDASPTPELDDPLSVRFQPVGLMASRCFQVSAKLSCLTCHDPHDSLLRDKDFYNSRCLTCHNQHEEPGRPDCISCHMPRGSPAPHLSFTDHRIR